MVKYIVSVTRTGYGVLDLEIEASSEEEAAEIALDCAGGESFSEHHSEYQVDQVETMGATKPKTIIINGIETQDCAALHHDD